MNKPHSQDPLSLIRDFDDFFDTSLCGYATTDAEGSILFVNAKFAGWLGYSKEELAGKRFSDLLSIGGKIYYETHLWPLLRMQDFFDEVALELHAIDGKRLQVFVNAQERRNEQQQVQFIRFTIFKASDRRLYEQNLKDARKHAEHSLTNEVQLRELREQIIAVLGHDLRNPLGSIRAGAALLSRPTLSANDEKIVNLITRSAGRMSELIDNVMDFARSRLGEGIILQRKPAVLTPVLRHVIQELETATPGRDIETDFDIEEPVYCDPARIGQLLSNLVANAITHGSNVTPVTVSVVHRDHNFELVVCNSGNRIPAEMIDKIFEPFTRETSRPSQHGLGLGLYIVSQISRAHGGETTATSTDLETCFTFRMSTEI